jgi:hypothetical protein
MSKRPALAASVSANANSVSTKSLPEGVIAGFCGFMMVANCPFLVLEVTFPNGKAPYQSVYDTFESPWGRHTPSLSLAKALQLVSKPFASLFFCYAARGETQKKRTPVRRVLAFA